MMHHAALPNEGASNDGTRNEEAPNVVLLNRLKSRFRTTNPFIFRSFQTFGGFKLKGSQSKTVHLKFPMNHLISFLIECARLVPSDSLDRETLTDSLAKVSLVKGSLTEVL